MLERFEQFSGGITAIYRIVHKIEREEMEKYGLKGTYALYLETLYRYPEGLTVGQLHEICEKDKAAVSRTVAEMENLNLVARQSTASPYRAKILLTPSGKEAADYVCRKISQAVSLASQGLTEQDKAFFYAAMKCFVENLQEISQNGLPACQ